MTRRGAVIAALLSPFAGALNMVTGKEPTVYINLEIPEHLPRGLPSSVPSYFPGPNEDTLTVRYPLLESYDYVLRVSYKNRVVYLTGDEIMDELEGK